MAVIGPSGAGKSTLLRLIAGLDEPSPGRIECDGELWFGDGRDLPPERRRCGFVFQDYALFPHLDVRANVAFGADGDDVGPLLARVGIDHLAGAHPAQLSGGERQRVALARALAIGPRALLLDEPLSALDPATRGAVAAELATLLREAAVPVLVVTHSYEEAVSLTDRVAVIEAGRLVQQGAARELLEAPDHAVRGRVRRHQPACPAWPAAAGCSSTAAAACGWPATCSGRVAVLVAPWEITLALAVSDSSAQNSVTGAIQRLVPLGNRVRVVLPGITAEVTPESAERLGLRPGLEVVASWKATSTRVVTGG